MKLMLVSQDEFIHQIIESTYTARNVALMWYRNPVKAMDNLDETDPDIVIFCAEDFPRHWKPFVTDYRGLYPDSGKVFILLTGETFPEEELSKASFLEVNGLVPTSYEDSGFVDSLDEILARYIDLEDIRSAKRYRPRVYDTIEFIFNHPQTGTLITGKLLDITDTAVSYRPDNTLLTEDLEKNSIIERCSLQIGDSINDCKTRIIRNHGVLVLQILDNKELKNLIDSYIRKRSERSLNWYQRKKLDKRFKRQ